MEIQNGDTVELKSDSTTLFTVGNIFKGLSGAKMAEIYWYNKNTLELLSKQVPVSILVKVN